MLMAPPVTGLRDWRRCQEIRIRRQEPKNPYHGMRRISGTLPGGLGRRN
jgi:hypothetical protein